MGWMFDWKLKRPGAVKLPGRFTHLNEGNEQLLSIEIQQVFSIIS